MTTQKVSCSSSQQWRMENRRFEPRQKEPCHISWEETPTSLMTRDLLCSRGRGCATRTTRQKTESRFTEILRSPWEMFTSQTITTTRSWSIRPLSFGFAATNDCVFAFTSLLYPTLRRIDQAPLGARTSRNEPDQQQLRQ